MEKGNVHLVVEYAGYEMFNDNIDACEFMKKSNLRCPVEAGNFEFIMSSKIPEIAPPGGPYTGKLVLTDQDGKLATCLTFKFEMDS